MAGEYTETSPTTRWGWSTLTNAFTTNATLTWYWPPSYAEQDRLQAEIDERRRRERAEFEAESQRRYAERVEAQRREYAERQRLIEAARERARELLTRLLPKTERTRLEQRGYFKVVGSAGGSYRIERGYSGNVRELDSRGRVRASLCAHPHMYDEGYMLPSEDAMIAQLLMLTTDEPAFLAIANRSAAW